MEKYKNKNDILISVVIFIVLIICGLTLIFSGKSPTTDLKTLGPLSQKAICRDIDKSLKHNCKRINKLTMSTIDLCYKEFEDCWK